MMHHALRPNLVLYSPQIVWDYWYLIGCGNKALVTLVGTDMPSQMNFLKKFMSHKFKCNGLKYKVGVCIATGQILWIHGPSWAGVNNTPLAWLAFISFLDDYEMAVADSGYRGGLQHIKTPDLMHFFAWEKSIMMQQLHELVTRLSTHVSKTNRLWWSISAILSCFIHLAFAQLLSSQSSTLKQENLYFLFDILTRDKEERGLIAFSVCWYITWKCVAAPKLLLNA